MNRAFFSYWLDYEDLENCLDVMDKNITPEAVEKLKEAIMYTGGSKLSERLTETAFDFIYAEIERLFPDT